MDHVTLMSCSRFLPQSDQSDQFMLVMCGGVPDYSISRAAWALLPVISAQLRVGGPNSTLFVPFSLGFIAVA